ncbi:hypothetical protein D3C72_2263510 [compost metagenome]
MWKHPDIGGQLDKASQPTMLGCQTGDHGQLPAVAGQYPENVQIAAIRPTRLQPGSQQQQALARPPGQGVR